jgi:hypothetical protein
MKTIDQLRKEVRNRDLAQVDNSVEVQVWDRVRVQVRDQVGGLIFVIKNENKC